MNVISDTDADISRILRQDSVGLRDESPAEAGPGLGRLPKHQDAARHQVTCDWWRPGHNTHL